MNNTIKISFLYRNRAAIQNNEEISKISEKFGDIGKRFGTLKDLHDVNEIFKMDLGDFVVLVCAKDDLTVTLMDGEEEFITEIPAEFGFQEQWLETLRTRYVPGEFEPTEGEAIETLAYGDLETMQKVMARCGNRELLPASLAGEDRVFPEEEFVVFHETCAGKLYSIYSNGFELFVVPGVKVPLGERVFVLQAHQEFSPVIQVDIPYNLKHLFA